MVKTKITVKTNSGSVSVVNNADGTCTLGINKTEITLTLKEISTYAHHLAHVLQDMVKFDTDYKKDEISNMSREEKVQYATDKMNNLMEELNSLGIPVRLTVSGNNEPEEEDEEVVEEVDYDSLSDEDKAYYDLHKEHEKAYEEELADFEARCKSRGIDISSTNIEWSDIIPEPTEEETHEE